MNEKEKKKIEEALSAGRPPLEVAIGKVSTKYELVHAAAKRVVELLKQENEFIIREGRKKQLKKLTFKAIEE
jgi:DNA-directed RNA polymerase subunit omega